MPLIFALSAVGAYADQQRMGDVIVAFGFGVAGYFMKKHGWPRMPLVVALLLGAAIERHLHITTRLHALGRLEWMSRPLVLLLVVLVLLNVLVPLMRRQERPR